MQTTPRVPAIVALGLAWGLSLTPTLTAAAIQVDASSVEAACINLAGNSLVIPDVTVGLQANRILVVGVGAEENNNDCNMASPAMSVTYGAQPMTRAANALSGSSNWRACNGLFYLLDPPTGTDDVTITMPNGVAGDIDTIHAGALVIYGAEQAAPEAVKTAGSAQPTNPVNTVITTVSPDALVVDVFTQGNPGTFSTTQAGQQERFESVCGTSGSAGSTKAVAVAGNTTLGWSHSAPLRYAHTLAAFAASTSVCGNGVTEPGEQCDDGNASDDDCCTAECVTQPADSACDDGQFCTSNDRCNAIGSCHGFGGNACGFAEVCNESTDSCDPVPAFHVNSNSEGGDAVPGDGICETASGNAVCTLRAAVEEANATEEIETVYVPAGSYALTSTLVGVYPMILVGEGADATRISQSSSLDVVFEAREATDVHDLSLEEGRHGIACWNGCNLFGTAIRQSSSHALWPADSDAYLEDCLLEDNTGYGIPHFTDAEVVIRRSTLRRNQVGAGQGGENASVTIYDSIISENREAGVDALGTDGGVRIENSTISDNDGPGIRYSNSCTGLVVRNSTISGNETTGNGGGIRIGLGGGGEPAVCGGVSLENLTVTDNVADSDGNGSGDGGGIYEDNTSGVPFAKVSGTVVSGNRDLGGEAPDCASATGFDSLGYNLVGDSTGCTLAGDPTGVQLDVDPLLEALADNGGGTPTHALLEGSPALDAGNPGTCGSGVNSSDQRHVVRPQGAGCDLGAYERRPCVTLTPSAGPACFIDHECSVSVRLERDDHEVASVATRIGGDPAPTCSGVCEAGSDNPDASCVASGDTCGLAVADLTPPIASLADGEVAATTVRCSEFGSTTLCLESSSAGDPSGAVSPVCGDTCVPLECGQCETADCNSSGGIEAGDPVCTVLCLIDDAPASADCLCAADCNCVAGVEASDPVCSMLRVVGGFTPDTCEASQAAFVAGATSGADVRVHASAPNVTASGRNARVKLALRGSDAGEVAALRTWIAADEGTVLRVALAKRARERGFGLSSSITESGVVVVVTPPARVPVASLDRGVFARVRVTADAAALELLGTELASTGGLPLPIR